jgi:hypothetical protein
MVRRFKVGLYFISLIHVLVFAFVSAYLPSTSLSLNSVLGGARFG